MSATMETVDEYGPISPRIAEVLAEFHETIARHYPEATFEVQRGENPLDIYLVATVDVEDTDEVFSLVRDRMVDVQIDEGLPVYVTVLPPIERVLEQLRRQEAEQGRALPPTG